MILANTLTTPALGTIIWTTFIFLILLGLLRAFAWGPILAAINSRNESIKGSLEAADEARKEMERLHADNEVIMKEARMERDQLLKEARDARDQMIAEAKDQARAEAEKLIEKARVGIEREKNIALTEMRNQVAEMSVAIAEKILRQNLKGKPDQDSLVNKLLDDVDFSNN